MFFSRILDIKENRYFPYVSLFFVYALFGHAALRLHSIAGFAAFFWPPAGVSLAGLTVFGMSLWPSVFLGALTVNLMAGASPQASTAIAIGNTIEAALGAGILRYLQFDSRLGRVRDVLLLACSAGVVGSMCSAAIGTWALMFFGDIPRNQHLNALLAAASRAWWEFGIEKRGEVSKMGVTTQPSK